MSRRKRVHTGPGVPCPRCKVTSARFVHPPGFIPPTEKGWYSFWFECRNPDCVTTTFMRGGYNPPTGTVDVDDGDIAPGFAKSLEKINLIAELREAADLWLHAYLGLYVIHYGPEKAASMRADPVEGKRLRETLALLERTATDVPW